MSARQGINRRTALQAAIASGGLLAAPAFVRGRNLNERLQVAVIGCGGRGRANMQSVETETITAVCDVNANHLDFAAKRHPQALKTRDFRRIYDDPKRFDAVVVSTCEHTHAFATMPALKLNKHVYCEKPLTHNVWEARKIREAYEQTEGLATQMGTQIHAGDNYRRVVELIQKKAIGPVREVHVWVSRAWGWHENEQKAKAAGDFYVSGLPAKADPIPSELDWDLWLGPVKKRPFHRVYFPGPKWYRWWDFGNGTMSDLGSHWVDLPFWALNLKAPLTVEASGPPVHPDLAPASMTAKYEYGARDGDPPLTLTWSQGVYKPKLWRENKIPPWNSGVLFVGDDGMLLSDYRKHVLLPEKKFRDFQRPEPFIPKSRGHHAEWVHACKTGEPTTCHFTYAGWLTEANHLGNVAYRVGKKLQWDAEKMKATNAPEADQYLRREYRPAGASNSEDCTALSSLAARR